MGLSEQLEALKADEAYKSLQAWKPKFNLYKALGIVGRELSHSALLAYLLDPAETHKLESRFLRTFLERAVSAPTLTHGKSLEPLRPFVDRLTKSTKVVIRREHFSIDVVVEIEFSRDTGLVVGIENKIWAGEQEKQLERYQDTLRDRYPQDKWTPLAVFLTPGGYMPWTGKENHSATPCVAVDWGEIGAMIADSVPHAHSTARDFLSNTALHIEEDIMGDDERKVEVRKLYANPKHREALRAIVEFQPSLGDCADRIEKCISNVIEAATGARPTNIYRGRNCREIAFEFGPPPLRLLVHHYPGQEPGVFLGVFHQDYNPADGSDPRYAAFAKRADKVVDPEMTQFQGFWKWWHRVIATDPLDAPGHSMPESMDPVFDDAFVEWVVTTAESELSKVGDALRKVRA